MTATLDGATTGRRDVLDNGVALLGWTISWSVTGALVARDDLVRDMTGAGFGGLVPKNPPSAKRALRRAIYEWASARSGEALFDEDALRASNGRARLVRPIRAGRDGADGRVAAPVIYALVEELNLGGRLGLNYATAYRFRYDPGVAGDEGVNTGQLSVSSSAFGAFAAEERSAVLGQITPIWEKHKALYNGADLSDILIAIVRAARGISVESGTGVWFLPASKGAAVDGLERLVGRFGPGAHIRVFENVDSGRTRDSFRGAALDDVMADIRREEARMGGYEEANQEKPGSVRPATLTGLVRDLIGIREKAALYAETVGLRDERVQEGLLAVSARAVALSQANRDRREERTLGGSAPAAAVAVAAEERDGRD